MNNSENKEVHEYAVGDICMVSQTNKCLQFHTTHIIQTLDNTLTVRYLKNSESRNIPMGPQIKLLNQIGRGAKRRHNMRCSLPIVDNRQVTDRQDNKERENISYQDRSSMERSRGREETE